MNTTVTDNRPLFQLTVFEFQNLLTATLPEMKTDPIPATPEHKRIYGIRGLATYLSISVPSAQKIKSSKKFPFYESGNKVFMYSDEVDSGLRVAALEKKERAAK